MPKILVTGGAGYIGSNTLIELLALGYEVISIDNFSNSNPAALDRVAKISGKEIQNYAIDLCDLAAVENVFAQHKDIEGVIHFAAFKAVGESVEEPLKYYHNNFASLVNILKAANAAGVKQFVFSSSCSLYGNVQELPVTELSPVAPISPYAYTKLVGERIITDFAPTSKMQFVLLRYFNPVGAHHSGMNGEQPIGRPNNLVPFITQTAAGILPLLTVYGGDYPTRDGTCIRDYIHVSDIADAHIRALEWMAKNNQPATYEIFNLGTGNGVSVKEAIHAFEKVSGVSLKYTIGPKREGDVAAVYSNNAKVEAALQWKPKRNLEEMMSSAWKWQLHLLGKEG